MATITGTAGNDIIDLLGTGEDVEVIALAGNDKVTLESFDRVEVNAGSGNDAVTVYFGSHAELTGGGGNDVLDATQVEVSYLNGGSGNDRLFGWIGEETHLRGGDGDDEFVIMAMDRGSADGGAGNDYFEIWDSRRDIVLTGGEGDDFYYLVRLYHPDIVEAAGGGTDTVKVQQESYTAHANIENIIYDELIDEHGDHNDPPDTIRGNDLDNRITATGDGVGARVFGEGGNDDIRVSDGSFFVNGGSGNDVILSTGEGGTLRGGSGNDRLLQFSYYDAGTLEGGTGRDTFVAEDEFDEYHYHDSITRIADFNADQDRIELIDFNRTGEQGVLAARRFHAGTGDNVVAQDADDRIIFNRTTGDLFYDADGNGAGEQFRIFHLTIVSGNFTHADIDIR